MKIPYGSLPAIPTPFQENRKIDYGAFREIIEFQIAHKTRTLFVMGSAGEPTLLSMEERKEIVSKVVPMCEGRISVYFGATLPTTEQTVDFSRYAQDNGADGLIYSAPVYIMPSEPTYLTFLKEAMGSVTIPVGLYQNKGRTGVSLSVRALKELHDSCENFVVVKEASADTRHLQETCRELKGKVNVMGVDAPSLSNLLFVQSLGGQGVSHIAGNLIPEVMNEMCEPWDSFEQMERTKELYFRYYDLIEAVNRFSNPVGLKAAMNLFGLPAGHTRRPNQDLSGESLDFLKGVLERFGLLQQA